MNIIEIKLISWNLKNWMLQLCVYTVAILI